MTIQEAIKDIEFCIKPVIGGKSLEMACNGLRKLDNLVYIIENVKNKEDLNGCFYVSGWKDACDCIKEIIGEISD